jgi:hypothetical protein
VIEAVRGDSRCRKVGLRASRSAAEGGELEAEALVEVPICGSGTDHGPGERTDDPGRKGA